MSRFHSEKLYYSISEVAKIADVPHYLIRKWEEMFPKLSPARNSKGNRVYTNKDISIILAIKKILKDHHHNIEEAKSMLDSFVDVETKPNEDMIKTQFKAIKVSTTIPKTVDEQRLLLLEIKNLASEGLLLIKEIENLEQVPLLNNNPNLKLRY